MNRTPATVMEAESLKWAITWVLIVNCYWLSLNIVISLRMEWRLFLEMKFSVIKGSYGGNEDIDEIWVLRKRMWKNNSLEHLLTVDGEEINFGMRKDLGEMLKGVSKDKFGSCKIHGMRRNELIFFGGVSCEWGKKKILVGGFKNSLGKTQLAN